MPLGACKAYCSGPNSYVSTRHCIEGTLTVLYLEVFICGESGGGWGLRGRKHVSFQKQPVLSGAPKRFHLSPAYPWGLYVVNCMGNLNM